MEHTSPNPAASRWQQLGDYLMDFYRPVEAGMTAIHAAHPESKFGEPKNIQSCDAFQRYIDLVPNVAQYAAMLDFDPDPQFAELMLRNWRPKTEAIMKDAETALLQYGAKDSTVYALWKSNEILQEIYDEAKKVTKRTPHVTAADLAAANQLGQNGEQRKKKPMELPDATPVKIPNPDRFKAEIKEMEEDFTELRAALQEPAQYSGPAGEPVSVEQSSPKGQLKHYVSHALTGFHVLHDQQTVGTAQKVLELRDQTTQAFRGIMTEFQFRENTVPRDILTRLDIAMSRKFQEVESLVSQAQRDANASAGKRLGTGGRQAGSGWAKE